MRSAFSRIFIPGTLLLLASLTVVGGFFQFLVRGYLGESAVEDLKTNCATISRLASAYYIEESLSDQDFLVNLSVAASVSGADAVICDLSGKLILCSDSPMGCSHQGMQLQQEFVDKVLAEGCITDAGRIEGLYPGARYVVAIPIRAEGVDPAGIVILSAPITETTRVLTRLSTTYIYISVATVFGALFIMLYLARKQSSPLKEMANAAIAFGHGDMKARVPIREDDPTEVRETALAFNNMAVSIEKSEYQRQEFVANVSHELKTPMTTIGGYVDGILDGTIPPEMHRHYMQIVSDETKRLSRLVRSMLDISRLQEQQTIPEDQKIRFDIGECAGQVLFAFEQAIERKHLSVEAQIPEHPLYTFAHRDHITQVIYNLLDNAVKFCPDGEMISLQVREQADKICVTVANDGPAIPPEQLPLVFDRFHKLDKSRNREQEGWGLGLYIVKTIVCSHGEDISVTSRDGKTAFTFTLPLIL